MLQASLKEMENSKNEGRASNAKLNTIIDECEEFSDFSSDDEEMCRPRGKRASTTKNSNQKDTKPRKSASKTMSQLEQENDKLKSTILIFKQKLSLRNEDITEQDQRWANQIKALQVQVQSFLQAEEEVRTEMCDLALQADDLKYKNKEVNRQLNETLQSEKKLVTENKQLEQRNQDLMKQIEEAEEERSDQRQEVRESKDKLSAL